LGGVCVWGEGLFFVGVGGGGGGGDAAYPSFEQFSF